MKKILPFFLFLALIPSTFAQETNVIPSGIGYVIGIAFGVVILFFLVDYSLNVEINEKFIEEAVLVFVGAIVSVSIVSGSLYATPETPLYHIVCGNGICDTGEIFDCIQDCGYVCGDGICNTNPPWGEWINCPQDCPINNTLLISELQTFFRPVIAGLQIKTPISGYCSLGAVFNINNTYYGLTASHCSNYNNSIIFYNPQSNNNSYIIGEVVEINLTNDIELVRLNVTANSIDFLNNTVDCVANDYTTTTNKVYKIGRTTGLTFGNIITQTDTSFNVEGENSSIFCDYGDSGSGIVLISRPRRLMGITIFISNNGTICGSPSPQAIINSFNISLPVCPVGIYI